MRKLGCAILCFILLLAAAVPALAEERVLTISTAEEFMTFAESCRLDSYSLGMTVSLEADIDLTGTEFTGIPIFSGTFQGNCHAITGLQITTEGSDQGLFRYLTATAVVQDLNVQGDVQPGGSRNDAGGIAGSNEGSIQNCSFQGTVSGGSNVGGLVGSNAVTGMIEGCRVEGQVYGNHFVGGIAGQNSGVIRSCTNSAQINTTAQQNSVEISDITMDTLTNSEASNTVTDIGGIAGVSSGVIRLCENRGSVGYRHMGYNIGGIAGTQSGYIADCQNYAQVQGRKEVGGIAGQMEPAAVIAFSEDTLQTLQGQLNTVTGLVNRASGNAQSNADQIESQISLLQDQAKTAQDAVDAILPDAENLQLPDPDAVLAAQNTLSSTVSAMPDTLNSIASATQTTVSGLSRDLQAVAGQLSAMGETINGASENLGGSITDISDQDTAEDLTGKVEGCVNHGGVLADLNAGGIAGAMAMENDLDIVQDWQTTGEESLNFQSEVRAVILNCENRGTVTGKKQNAGGIVGWQAMGLTRGCTNTGAMDAADYAGGIAGRSQGYIRESYARCAITGDAYVGGIAGSGMVVSDCRSMVKLSGREKVGAVLGAAEENDTDAEAPVSGNLYVYVDADPGAVDGISYENQAQSLALDTFIALEDLPELFKAVSVTFVYEDGTETAIALAPGSALATDSIPQVPAKAGFAGQWEGLADADLTEIRFDLRFEASYISHGSTVAGTETRDGRPILLVQGDFSPDAAVNVAEPETEPVLSEDEVLLESWQFAVTGSQQVSAVRCLLPDEAEADRLQVYVRAGSDWRKTAYTIDSSYIVIALEQGDDGIALAEDVRMEMPWLLIALGAAAAMTVITVVTVRSRKKTAKKPSEQAQKS